MYNEFGLDLWFLIWEYICFWNLICCLKFCFGLVNIGRLVIGNRNIYVRFMIFGGVFRIGMNSWWWLLLKDSGYLGEGVKIWKILKWVVY